MENQNLACIWKFSRPSRNTLCFNRGYLQNFFSNAFFYLGHLVGVLSEWFHSLALTELHNMISCEHFSLCHSLINSCYKVWMFNSDTTERPDLPMVSFVKFTLLALFSVRCSLFIRVTKHCRVWDLSFSHW